MIIFSDYVVVEQYHSGGFGGEIPLVCYSRNSETGQILERHFDFIWNDDTTNIPSIV
ncbi:MAG: hypothetical protein JZU65_00855 [Chlorobium sp.]|jgi:hypothetical protein|nr:hypothetical protein [Chlorobium sp.]